MNYISRKFVSLLALLLVVMMLLTACGSQGETSSASLDESSTPSEAVEESSEKSSTIEGNSSVTSAESSSSKVSTNSAPQSASGKQNAFDNANDANFLKSAPKGEVHILMWRKFIKSEQQLVDQYEKLTGNKVKVTITTEREYSTKLVSMVSGGNAPDVVMFQSNNFPGLVTKSLQPLNTKYFQLDSDCWNKNYMDAYRINGVYFGVAMPSSWSCEDCTYVTYYSPQILKNCGVKETPYQLYQKNQWNWDTQSDIIRKVKNKGFTGLSLQGFDMFMLSAGVDFAKYDGSKYTNQLGSVKGNSLLTSAWMEVTELKQDDCVSGWDLNNVQQGKVGLFTSIAYGLCADGTFYSSSFAKNLEAVPVAGPKGGTAYTPVRPKVWGVPKNAKNPAGAAYFLRYYLDIDAFDFDSSFYNKQFKEVFEIVTSSNAKKIVMHGSGVTNYVDDGVYDKICSTLAGTNSQNITVKINSMKGSVQTAIQRANKDLARIKGK